MLKILYHEANLFACKDKFAKPSIMQHRVSGVGAQPKDLRSKAFCIYYTILGFKSQCFGIISSITADQCQ